MLFTHHPVDMEVSGVGFLPISPDTVERMRAKGVSVYACHAPMDCHDEIGTNASIVQAFDVQVERSFAEYGNGYAGRIGSIARASLNELVSRGKKVFGVERVETGGARPSYVTKVAIVAGGGDDLELLEEAERMGAQVFITGEWYTRTTPRDERGSIWAVQPDVDRPVQQERASGRIAGDGVKRFMISQDIAIALFESVIQMYDSWIDAGSDSGFTPNTTSRR